MRSHIVAPLAASLLALHAATSDAAPVSPPSATPAASWWQGLEIGTRILHVSLDEDYRPGHVRPGGDPSRPSQYFGTFLGSLTKLEVDQDYAPLRLYLQYFVNEYVGFGLSYDALRVDTRDWYSSDGFVEIAGPLLYAVARKPTESAFTPFAELGLGFYQARYDPNPSWTQRGDVSERAMAVKDPTAFYLAFGVDCEVAEQWSLNLYVRSVFNATVDAEAYYPRQKNKVFERGEFPLDYYGIGIGLKYAFP